MIFQYTLLAIAAFLAGNLNAVAGGGTFLIYPLLLWAGCHSIAASATSTMIVWPGVIASLPAYTKEIKSNRKLIKKLILPALIGGIIGSYILAHTTNNTFGFIAPLLVVIASLVLHFQNGIDHFFRGIRLAHPHQRVFIISIFVFAIAIYGAYFGAGIGILLLGCLSILGIKNLYSEIALKNVLALVFNSVAVAYFLHAHLIDWHLAPFMIIFCVLGGYFGSHLVRRIDKNKVKDGVVIFGFVVAAILLIVQLS